MNKQELESLLKYHDDLYYNQDSPEITDAEYDALKNQYVELYGEYDYVPGEAAKDSVKYEHTTNVSSLGKLQISDKDGIRKALEELWPVVIQPKMDGLTLVVYPNGQCVTRGNGHVGEVVTSNIFMGDVEGIGKIHTEPIRCEIVMPKSKFAELNAQREAEGKPKFENCRNAAAGMLRQKNAKNVKGLKAYAYNILRETEKNDATDQIYKLKDLGWNTVGNFDPCSIDEAFKFIDTVAKEMRDKLDYDIDGLVIKHDGNKKFGETGHHPKNAVAIKFEAEGDWTVIKDIEWTVGRTGRITPVAILEPVRILGSTVTKATLHNYGIIKGLGLDKVSFGNTLVKVIKANDVIPAIVGVKHPENDNLNSVKEPCVCPVCGAEIKKENDMIFCTNDSCSSRVLYRLTHMAQRDAFDIEGLSEETAKKLIEYYKDKLRKIIKKLENGEELDALDEPWTYEEYCKELEELHPSFIYRLRLDEIKSLPGFAEKSATNLFNAINKCCLSSRDFGFRPLTFDRVLYGVGIPLVGKSTAKDIAEFYYGRAENELCAFAEDFDNGFEQLRHLDGIGDETIASLLKNAQNMLVPLYFTGVSIVDLVPKNKATEQLNFVITGKFDIGRNEIKDIIESAGHKVSGSVSSKTSFLLASPGEESTTKYKKAVSLGIQIIHTLDELNDIIGA